MLGEVLAGGSVADDAHDVAFAAVGGGFGGRSRIGREWDPSTSSKRLSADELAELRAQDPEFGGPADLVCCPVGTGGTLAGIAAALPPGARALGVAVLKGGAGYLEGEVARLHREGWPGREIADWCVAHTHHVGGYGRVPPRLAAFASDFEARHGVPVELRYVAKNVGQTVILITHRMASVRDADLVHVLHQGRLAETGTPDELLNRGGRYAEMYNIQAAQFTHTGTREDVHVQKRTLRLCWRGWSTVRPGVPRRCSRPMSGSSSLRAA
ncbi:hypothetical protein RM780_13915 [Streptomyces sp. DSM 44917]|uniref:Tryptophan synthase beta chain-like PALP domain-containing protein n=1 Tax=Streptomyces boetiae TaxID=3075541 RepID=A0ABU2L974_9ACTN|nr:hypothetical protein [Streptomyces sp. DSM 44917]MDT0308052.1 hypothetical protein [Streptomyces sp. DSM 44917]